MAKQWHQLEHLDHRALKKLQQDREKQVLLQKQEGDRKRNIIIGVSVGLAALVVFIFLQVINSRAEKKAFMDARALLYKSSVINVSGPAAFTRSFGDWGPLEKGLVFDKEQSFKTEKNSFLSVELQLKNQVKLASNSEMVVYPPVLEEKENKVKKENVSLTRGECTSSVGVDGREILEVEAGGVVAMGASGLFKVIYNSAKNTGEIVVKNGLVEVFAQGNPQKRVKVSGFYKVTFQKGQFSNPSQSSIIQYDWR